MNQRTLFCVLIISLAASHALAQANQSAPLSSGWIEVPDPSFKLRGAYCEKWKGGWIVGKQDGRVTIMHREHAREPIDELPLLPPEAQQAARELFTKQHDEFLRQLKREAKADPESRYIDRTNMVERGGDYKFHGYPFAGGWLFGYDLGEFGCGVYWIDQSRKELRRIGGNLIDLMPARDGILILFGLRHGTSRGSAVFLNPNDLAPKKPLPSLVDLGSTPIAAVLYRDDDLAGFYILTDNGIRELLTTWNDESFTLREFYITTLQPGLHWAGANSIAFLSADDKAYVGLADHVVVMQWLPRMNSYDEAAPPEKWYAHSSCVRRIDCKCVPATAEELKRAVQLP